MSPPYSVEGYSSCIFIFILRCRELSMERSESKTNSKVSSRIQGNDLSAQIKPYYRVHVGESGSNATEQPMEATLSHADDLLQRERQSYTEPMLSIVIPTYNSQRWISTLLETLLAPMQPYRSYNRSEKNILRLRCSNTIPIAGKAPRCRLVWQPLSEK